ncbi:hypothetical protein SB394_06060 [Burkholderia sp. BCCIQ04A]|uniref:Uncharacterized protein n=1 Tax=Burkholderia anthinoferrum TaxID=3090833 RepID=A0ABU5X078_9BURK|nr:MULTISPECIES: hypothetical protein [Burkholderia]MEB2508068.1 hypothetical protein [Burkholderia anthinoferrum]MEB2530813.1 hypothetical protein [Burkholderia anthinoferrum]MEB2565971.1 hypothetical protein [Burkholderia anthinoferrum]MEB2584053.1 hypothetical protein [Burkholderia anthinoferrum]MCA8107277.1 hypothetical protein [Burkholderia sp. AU36459]
MEGSKTAVKLSPKQAFTGEIRRCLGDCFTPGKPASDAYNSISISRLFIMFSGLRKNKPPATGKQMPFKSGIQRLLNNTKHTTFKLAMRVQETDEPIISGNE